jgi:hypothetical protein
VRESAGRKNYHQRNNDQRLSGLVRAKYATNNRLRRPAWNNDVSILVVTQLKTMPSTAHSPHAARSDRSTADGTTQEDMEGSTVHTSGSKDPVPGMEAASCVQA